MSILWLPAILADIFMLILFAVTPSRRTWPAVLPAFMFMGNFIASVGFAVGVAGGHEGVW